MDRKYKQRGYMDNDRKEKPKREPRPQGPKEFRPRQMPGFHDAYRCSMCGSTVAMEIELNTQCPKCKADLHSCKQCTFFDSAARFECTQPLTERIPRKNIRNLCTLFAAKKVVERETSSASAPHNKPPAARDAFDALFKK